MADDRVVWVAANRQTDGIISVKQAGGVTQVARVRDINVIVKERDALPVKHVSQHQREIPLGAGVLSPPEEHSCSQSGRVETWKPQLRQRRDIDRDVPWRA